MRHKKTYLGPNDASRQSGPFHSSRRLVPSSFGLNAFMFFVCVWAHGALITCKWHPNHVPVVQKGLFAWVTCVYTWLCFETQLRPNDATPIVQLGSEQALAPVREPDTFAAEAELQNVPNIAPVCAANIHWQKNGSLERTYSSTATLSTLGQRQGSIL